MVVRTLIGLSECVMVSLSCPVIPVPSEVGLFFVLLVDFDSNHLNLVVSQTYLDWELLGHDELVGFNGIEVVLGFLLDLALVLAILKHVLTWLLLLHHLLLIVPAHHLVRL